MEVVEERNGKVVVRWCAPGASGTAGYVWNGGVLMPCEYRELPKWEYELIMEEIEEYKREVEEAYRKGKAL